MSNKLRHTFKFSANNWQHLYSIKQAIIKANDETGASLKINGTIRNDALLNQQDTKIEIIFKQVSDFSDYKKTQQDELILGQLKKNPDSLHTTLYINEAIFIELKKNLIEYVDIEGIHIVVSCTLLMQQDDWQEKSFFDIVSLDYAMRGDA